MRKGFTLIEIVVVTLLIITLASIGIPSLYKLYRTYKFSEYSFRLEALVKWARFAAMERSTNIGICVSNPHEVRVYDLGGERNNNICNGTLLKRLQANEDFISFFGRGAGGRPGVAFDPRGFAIFLGRICVTDGQRYYKIAISRWGSYRIEKGEGTCT